MNTEEIHDQLMGVQENLSELLHGLADAEYIPDTFWTKILPNLHLGSLLPELIQYNHPVLYKMCNYATQEFFMDYKKQDKGVVQLAVENNNIEFLNHLIKTKILLLNPKRLNSLWENLYQIENTVGKKTATITIKELLKPIEEITELSLQKILKLPKLNEEQEILAQRVLKGSEELKSSLLEAYLFYFQKDNTSDKDFLDINQILPKFSRWNSYPFGYLKALEMFDYFLEKPLFKPSHETYIFFCKNGYLGQVKQVEKYYKNKTSEIALNQVEQEEVFSSMLKCLTGFGNPLSSLVTYQLKKGSAPVAMKHIYTNFFTTEGCDTLDDFWNYVKTQNLSDFKYVNFLAGMLEIEHEKVNLLPEKNLSSEVLLKLCFFSKDYLEVFLKKNKLNIQDNISIEENEIWFNCFSEIYDMFWTVNYQVKNQVGLKINNEHKEQFVDIMEHLINNYFTLYKNFKNDPENSINEFSKWRSARTVDPNKNRLNLQSTKKENVLSLFEKYEKILEKNILRVYGNTDNHHKSLKL